MKYTSAQANKLLKKLEEQKDILLREESDCCTFNCAVGENIDDVRPSYDFAETQTRMNTIDDQIRKIKHAINVFNSMTIVPEFDITIDQMLILIPQLTGRKSRLMRMQSRQPRERDKLSSARGGIIDYTYANYDTDEAAKEYEKAAEELRSAQLALDRINNSELIEIDV